MTKTVSHWLRVSILAGSLGALPLGCGGDEESNQQNQQNLAAPTNVAAMVLPGPAVHLTWKDIAGEHHYSIERKEGSGAFTEVSTTTFNVTQYHDATVEKGKAYTYRIAGAHDGGHKGTFSTEVTATP